MIVARGAERMSADVSRCSATRCFVASRTGGGANTRRAERGSSSSQVRQLRPTQAEHVRLLLRFSLVHYRLTNLGSSLRLRTEKCDDQKTTSQSSPQPPNLANRPNLYLPPPLQPSTVSPARRPRRTSDPRRRGRPHPVSSTAAKTREMTRRKPRFRFPSERRRSRSSRNGERSAPRRLPSGGGIPWSREGLQLLVWFVLIRAIMLLSCLFGRQEGWRSRRSNFELGALLSFPLLSSLPSISRWTVLLVCDTAVAQHLGHCRPQQLAQRAQRPRALKSSSTGSPAALEHSRMDQYDTRCTPLPIATLHGALPAGNRSEDVTQRVEAPQTLYRTSRMATVDFDGTERVCDPPYDINRLSLVSWRTSSAQLLL